MRENVVVSNTIKLYTDSGWKRWFAYIRFWDAPYREVEQMISKKGIILELGCGEGLFSNFIALSQRKRKVIGIEIDEKRVDIANQGLKNTSFIKADATLYSLPKAETIIMMHLLHHLNSRKKQEELIKRCSQALKKGGTIIIVEVEPKLSWKYLITWFTDHFLVPWLFENRIYSPIYFRKSKEWETLLKKFGLLCKITSGEKGKPFTHIIISCQKN